MLREKDGIRQILQQTRLMHPFYGDTQVPGGMAKHGEKIEDTAARKLLEETGLHSSSFRLGGIVRGTFYHAGEILQDILYHVCFADSVVGILQEETVYGRNFWTSLPEAIQNEQRSTAPISTVIQVYNDLERAHFNQSPFFYNQETFIVDRV